MILCSGYEIEKKDILECKNLITSTDPLMNKDLDDDSKNSADTVSLIYNVNETVKVMLKFNDFSITDEKSICWSNRYVWLLRTPLPIYKAKGGLYIVLTQKHTAPPSCHIRFRMNLSEELTSYNTENKSSDSSSIKSVNVGGCVASSVISTIEKEIFRRVGQYLELYYILYLCCPRNIMSRSPIKSSTQKVLLIDDAHNPIHALN